MSKEKNRNNHSSDSACHTYVYGVHGLTEWIAIIHVGRASVRIPFTGGAITGYGVKPAMFVTKSRAVSKLIEASPYFEKRIKRILPD